jgi:DNA-binding transcriptional MerR regulator
MGRLYRVGEVAALTRVSIRTLHHYDRIGLVRPRARSDAGYRLYAADDLLRLQQVLTLRYLGFPLARISDLLARPDFDLIASLHIQRGAVRDRIAELERIDAALGALLEQREATGEWVWESVITASAAVQRHLTQGEHMMEKYYTPEQMAQFGELDKTVPREEITAIEEGWTALLAEVRDNRDLDPADPAAQALTARWDELMERTTSHYRQYPELLEAIRANYERGAFESFADAPQQADFAFIERAKAAR